MPAYEEWCNLLSELAEKIISEGEFIRRRDKLILKVNDRELWAMAGLIGVAQGAVAFRLRAEQQEIFERFKKRQARLNGDSAD